MRRVLAVLLFTTTLCPAAVHTGPVIWGHQKFDVRDFDQPFTAVAAGGDHTLALRADGSVVAWGRNDFGQATVPDGLADVIGIAAGQSHSLALKADGTVIAWGNNSSGQTEVPAGLDNVTAIDASSNQSVAVKADGTVVGWGTFNQNSVPDGLSDVTAIASGGSHTLALKADGTVAAWGGNESGQTAVPPGLAGVAAISASAFYSLALKTDGTVVAWGSPTTGVMKVPKGLTQVAAISAGTGLAMALKTDGTVVVWGIDQHSRTKVPSGLSGVVAVAAGGQHAIALKSGGSVVGWGNNRYNQRTTPDEVQGLTTIATGDGHFAGLTSNGKVIAWGADDEGQTQVPEGLTGVLSLSTGDKHTVALIPGGRVMAWGSNDQGQSTVPVGLVGVTSIAAGGSQSLALKGRFLEIGWGSYHFDETDDYFLGNTAAIAAGGSHNVALKVDGQVEVKGDNSAGQAYVPTGLIGVTEVTAGGRHTTGLMPDSTVVAWGANDFGQSSVPEDLANVTKIAAGGDHTVALLADGSVVGWGRNDYGQSSTPAGLSGVTAIAAGKLHSVALVPLSAAPKMALFQGTALGENDEIRDAGSASDFGLAAQRGGKLVRTFTIANQGTAPLTLGTVTVSGTHAADFTVTQPAAAEVPPGESTTFQVTFQYVGPGRRSAIISLINNDPHRSPFTFPVTGFEGLKQLYPQRIVFTDPGPVYLKEGMVDLIAHSTSGLPVAFEVVSGPATVMGPVLIPSAAGLVTVRVTQAGGGLYAAAKAVTRVIEVKANPIGLTLTGLVQRYDGTPKVIGTVGAAGMVVVSYQEGGVFGPDAPTAAGRYAVRAVADGVTKTGTLVITKAPLHVVPVNKRKFAGEANPALTLEYEGFVGADDETVLTRAPTLSTTAKTTSPGGVYPITAKGGAAANYALVHRQGTLVVESFASGYEALLVDESDVPSGKLSLTVAKSGRSYSGSLALAGETTALRVSGPLVTNSGTETASGAATVVRNGVTYALTFTLPMNGQVTGAVTRASLALATAQGGRRLLSQPRGGMVDYSGAHTAVLKPAQPAGAGVPAGAGWARAAINSHGAVALVGKLGDGTAFTTSLLPDADATPGYRLWLQPYKSARVDTFLGGTFALNQHPVLNRGFLADGASLAWAKAERLTDKSYPEGFVPLEVSLKLDPWIKPSAIQPLAALLGLSGDSIEVAQSTTGSASDADLPTTVTLSTRNAVSVPGGSNPTKWQAKFNTANGTFTGSFELLDAGVKRKAPFSGVLRQPVEASDEVIGDGHFVIPATPGSAETLSGELLFTRP